MRNDTPLRAGSVHPPPRGGATEAAWHHLRTRSIGAVAGSGLAGALRSPGRAVAPTSGLVIDVAEYGSLGSSDDTATFEAAFNAAVLAGGGVVVAPYGAYFVTNLHVGAGVKVWFPGVTLMNIAYPPATTHCLIMRNPSSEILIYGVEIDGSKGAEGAVGILAQGERSRVSGVYVHDTGSHGILVDSGNPPATTHITVDHSRVQRSGHSGITVGSGAGRITRHTTIYANHIRDCVNASISVTGERVIVANNVTEETLPVMSSSADGLTGYSVGDSALSCVGNSFYTPHNHGVHLGGSRLSVVGNVIYEPAQSGIYIAESAVEGERLPSADFVVADNVIVSPGTRDEGQGNGVYAERASAGVISGNEVSEPRTYGISLYRCDTIGVSGNTVRTPGIGSCVGLTECQRVAISGNSLYGAAEGRGVEIEDLGAPASSDIAIAQNVIGENGIGAVNVLGGMATRVAVAGNAIGGNGGPAITLNGAESRTQANLTDTSTTLESATILTVGRDIAFATVTGSRAILSLNGENAEVGQVVALRFRDGCTLRNGGNLVLASTFVAPPNGMIVLVCDGSKWYESTRSSD